MIAADGVSYFYDGHPAVDQADLNVSAGEMIAIVGKSGSGKSTLLNVLAGLVVPHAGTVRFQGEIISDMNEDERARIRSQSFGFVLQFGSLVPELTLLENVSLPLLLRGSDMRTARAAAKSTLIALDIYELASRFPAQVSGGQRQRAAIARGVAGQPDLIFADEPTGALDTSNGLKAIELLRMAAARGAGVVIVTHDDDVARQCDRAVTMVDGSIRAQPRSRADA